MNIKQHYYILAQGLGVTGLYLFAISIFFSVAGANIGVACMGLGLLLFLPVHGQVIIQDRYFMTAILFTAYVYAAALLANSYWPHLADKNLEYASEWIRMGFLPALLPSGLPKKRN